MSTQPTIADRVERITVDVQTMRTSAGADYYVRIKIGRRSLHPYKFNARWKAVFEADTFAWLLGLRKDKPDLMAYGPETHPPAEEDIPEAAPAAP